MATGARAPVSVGQVDKTLNKPLQLTRDAASLTSNRRFGAGPRPWRMCATCLTLVAEDLRPDRGQLSWPLS